MDEALFLGNVLARAGYGTVEQILAMPSDVVLSSLYHNQFVNDYQNTYYQLNRTDKK